ncbi:EamA family transporter [Euhalothece natronophila Z-M001]|uniref:EamA family transporter n=1 Tax=Euhalothece natronophila Z-M001 TaxID=522448 RepID=A0A5B8NMW7_9CHRO|nr:EamA family transporter [Euhalothece natronophila]QDZ39620.1 EamA family transporter [Euhalothece natronophila Z-M001]
MTWVIFATLTALFESLKDVTSKRGLNTLDEYVVAWSMIFFTLPLMLPLLGIIERPELGENFIWALLAGGSLNIVSMLLYIRALKLADLSLAVPLITFTPLFLLVTSPIIVGEIPTPTDAVGIFCIVSGSYLLNLKHKAQGYLAPFKALVNNKGSQVMLLVAFIWSFSSTIDKVGVQNSSPTFWAIAIYIYIATGMLPIMLLKSPKALQQVSQNLPTLVPIGLLQGLGVLFQMQAINLTLVAHVISIKRMSALLSVIWGHLIFKEKGLRERMLGATIMVMGVLLITLL